MKNILKFATLSSLTLSPIASIVPVVSCASNQRQDFWLEAEKIRMMNMSILDVKIFTDNLDRWDIPISRICLLLNDGIAQPIAVISPLYMTINRGKNMIDAYFTLPISAVRSSGLVAQIKISAAPKECADRYHCYKIYFLDFTLYPYDDLKIISNRLILSTDQRSLLLKFQMVRTGEIIVKGAAVSSHTGGSIAERFDYKYESDKKTIDLTISTPPPLIIPTTMNRAIVDIKYVWLLPDGTQSSVYSIRIVGLYW